MPQCRAKISKGTRQCKKMAIDGGFVCFKHGGKAPQVMAAAKRRLLEMVNPALTRLEKVITNGEDGPAVRASLGVIDRTIGKMPRKTTTYKKK